MNNNIGEDRCSFEVSKLLKEKSFSVPVNSYYRISGDIRFGAATHYDWNHPKDQDDYYISCPTHALAIKWIRENFGIHIKIDWFPTEENLIDWDYSIQKIGVDIDEKGNSQYLRDYDPESSFSSPEEATEAALLYTLTKLI